jgi:hypothetical protein
MVRQRVADTTTKWRILGKDGTEGAVRIELERGTVWRFYWIEGG